MKQRKAKVVTTLAFLYFSRQSGFSLYLLQPAAAASSALQHGIGQSSIGQGKSQQASLDDVQDEELEQTWLPELTNENAIPAESKNAALSAITLFFMM